MRNPDGGVGQGREDVDGGGMEPADIKDGGFIWK